jgi:hypothetical protein
MPSLLPGISRISARILVAVVLATFPLAASSLWNWNYSRSGATANGTFTTVDTPDLGGGFLITAITGTVNTETITGLQAAGTPIPGNEPFAVDNLVFLGPGPQLTKNGFGFSTSGGNFANPFFADFLEVPGYLEYFSRPPFTPGTIGPEDSELPIQFSAARVATPEPASWLLVFGMLSVAGLNRSSRWKLAGRQNSNR